MTVRVSHLTPLLGFLLTAAVVILAVLIVKRVLPLIRQATDKEAPMSKETDRAIRRAQELEATGVASEDSDSDVLRSTGTMAIATLLSRITGFIKSTLLGASLGAAVFSSFNSANQLPNLVTEIVLGAVLTSLVVPVLVRAEKRTPTTAPPSFAALSSFPVCCCWW